MLDQNDQIFHIDNAVTERGRADVATQMSEKIMYTHLSLRRQPRDGLDWGLRIEQRLLNLACIRHQDSRQYDNDQNHLWPVYQGELFFPVIRQLSFTMVPWAMCERFRMIMVQIR